MPEQQQLQQQQQERHNQQQVQVQQKKQLDAGDPRGLTATAYSNHLPEPQQQQQELRAGDYEASQSEKLVELQQHPMQDGAERHQEKQGEQQQQQVLRPCVRVPPPSGGGSVCVDVTVVGSSISSTLICAALSRRGFLCLLCEPSMTYGGPHRSMRLEELLQWAEGGAGKGPPWDPSFSPRGPPCGPDDEERRRSLKKGLPPCPCCCHDTEAERGPPESPRDTPRTKQAAVHEDTSGVDTPCSPGGPRSPRHQQQQRGGPDRPASLGSGLGFARLLSATRHSDVPTATDRLRGSPPPGNGDACAAPGGRGGGSCGGGLSGGSPGGDPAGPSGGDPAGAGPYEPPGGDSFRPFKGAWGPLGDGFERRWYSFGPFLEPVEGPPEEETLEEEGGDTEEETETDASSTDSASTDATAETSYTATTSSTTDTTQTSRTSRHTQRPPPLLQPTAGAAATAPAAAAGASPAAGAGQWGEGPVSSPAPSLQQPSGDSPAVEGLQQQQQPLLLQQTSSSHHDPLTAALHCRRPTEMPLSEPEGDRSTNPLVSPADALCGAPEAQTGAAAASPGAATVASTAAADAAARAAGTAGTSAPDVGLAEAVEVAAAEAATAAAQAATAAAAAAAADAAAAAGEPPGSVEAQRLQMKHELMAEGSRFLIDLMPKCIYTSSDIIDVLIESGAARYLEFRSCDAAVLTAELQQQDDEEAVAGSVSSQQQHGSGPQQPARGQQPEQQEHQQDGQNAAADAASAVVGLNAYIAAVAAAARGPPHLGARTRDAFEVVAPVEKVVLEPTPMSKSQIFLSSLLSLAERRALMRFVAALGTPKPTTVSAPFASAADWRPLGRSAASAANAAANAQTGGGAAANCQEGDCWDCYLEKQGLNPHLRRLLTYGVCLCEEPLLPAAAAAPAAASAASARCKGGHIRRWTVSEGRSRLQLFVSGSGLYACKGAPLLYPLYGSGDLPQAFVRSAALSGALCMLGAAVERLQFVAPPRMPLQQQQQGHQQLHQSKEQQKQQQSQQQQESQFEAELNGEEDVDELSARLERSSSGLVLHCSNGERIHTKLLLYESGGIPAPNTEPLILRRQAQAFCRPFYSSKQQQQQQQQQVQQQKQQTQETNSTNATEGGGRNTASAAPPAAATSFVAKKVNAAAARGSEASSVSEEQDTLALEAAAATADGAPAADAAPAAQHEPPTAQHESPAAQHESPAANGAGGAADGASAAATAEGTTAIRSNEISTPPSCCRLLAICTEPVLGGPGFRIGVVVARAACGETPSQAAAAAASDSSYSSNSSSSNSSNSISSNNSGNNSSSSSNSNSTSSSNSSNNSRGSSNSSSSQTEAEVPVHVLQTDAACAVAPKGYFLLYLSHVCSAAVRCCSDEPLGEQQQQLKQQEVSPPAPAAAVSGACGCCSNGTGRPCCVGGGGQELAAARGAQTASCGCGVDAHCCTVLLRALRGLLRSAGGLRTCYFLCSFRYTQQVAGAAAAAAAAASVVVPLGLPTAPSQQQQQQEQEQHQAQPDAAAASTVDGAINDGKETTACEGADAEAGGASTEVRVEGDQDDDPELLLLEGAQTGGSSRPVLPAAAAPCGVLSLPDACVAPCFTLLEECDSARLLVQELLQQQLQPKQLIIRGPQQSTDELDGDTGELDETLKQLTDLLHAQQGTPTPL
ncbi:hypothetical protein, conserved [Eimeria maxima]|uniref:GDP dissociation inhibitor domain-containing protein n=1 Tax=Eimeria maxima TaxID=5804 RepID=U6MH18_EIMMA|nr:hypothetical protein, conserved [Eimeria maxima]CDJ61754.1 hypothetical protein, conserved [Eimeria maxima]